MIHRLESPISNYQISQTKTHNFKFANDVITQRLNPIFCFWWVNRFKSESRFIYVVDPHFLANP